MEFLKLDNNGSVTPKMVEKSMKKKLKSFNILLRKYAEFSIVVYLG
jgi:hypothetical protein